MDGSVRVDTTVAASADEAFEWVIEALRDALARDGIELEPGPDGALRAGGDIVGRVVEWRAGERAMLDWRPAPWEPERRTRVELRVQEHGDGASRIALEHRGLEPLLGDAGEVAGWFAERVAAPLLRATAPAAMGDWITDRRARRPSGPQARGVYRDPTYHRPNFRAILAALALTPDDFLLEVGCGGGALLQEALASGCRAAAVDHSPDMVRLARATNREAVEAGRLEVREASADRLPFADDTFTRAAMTGVLGFLPRPVEALAEIRRVLVPGGQLALFTGSPEMRGTMAAPEPMASRLSFYEDDELAALARDAGLVDVRVERPDLGPFARPEELPELSPADLDVFSQLRGQLLLAAAPR